MREYIFTDLACELPLGQEDGGDLAWEEERSSETIRVLRSKIETEEEERHYRRKRGTYVTVLCSPIWQMKEAAFAELGGRLAGELRDMIRALTGIDQMNESVSVLVAGLGNAGITADALGPATVEKITVTRHLFDLYGMRSKRGRCAVSAMIPGVLGNTGIETAELIRGAVETVNPDVLIAVDSLVAKGWERIASTVQLCDTGLSPGSGIGNLRRELRRETVGVPVIALGVPTVVSSSTLIAQALTAGGISEIPPEMKVLLQNGTNFFVTPKETDLIVRSVSHLLASAIDQACTAEE
ncbi:MAG: GPR endopeptidase [Clostridia bacterium]|nr:GPR endopeptidase [Clostridia bacterium]